MFLPHRSLSSSIQPKRLIFSRTKFLLYATFVSPTEKIMTHLQKDPNGSNNMEKFLASVKDKLDNSCVNEVLKRCAVEKPKIGLRFFIWAGIQSSYRHCPNMYAKAFNVLEIEKNPEFVKDVIEDYGVENCGVSVKMFKVVLNLCNEAKDSNLGLWVLKKMKVLNCRPDTTAYNVVIWLFCQEGKVDEAMGLMREMGFIDLYPDMITYVSMIKGLCDVGRLEDACGLIKTMNGHGCLPNAVVYSAILDGIGKFGTLERSLEFLAEMEKESESCKLNVVTYTTVIKIFCEKGRSVEAVGILDRMKSFGCLPNRITMSVLIKGLCKDGYIEDAHKVIDKVAEDSASCDECYSSLVIALWRIGKHKDAEMAFRRMLACGLRPDGLASSTLIRWLCLEERCLDAFLFYEGIEKSGSVSTIDSDIYSILLAGLCQENHLVEAAKVASLMLKRGVLLKSSYKDNVVKNMNNLGEEEMIPHIRGLLGHDKVNTVVR